jgi:hypothetical protein
MRWADHQPPGRHDKCQYPITRSDVTLVRRTKVLGDVERSEDPRRAQPAARERAKEMAVFALIVLASAWPVIYMVITVVKVLSRGRP